MHLFGPIHFLLNHVLITRQDLLNSCIRIKINHIALALNWANVVISLLRRIRWIYIISGRIHIAWALNWANVTL